MGRAPVGVEVGSGRTASLTKRLDNNVTTLNFVWLGGGGFRCLPLHKGSRRLGAKDLCLVGLGITSARLAGISHTRVWM